MTKNNATIKYVKDMSLPHGDGKPADNCDGKDKPDLGSNKANSKFVMPFLMYAESLLTLDKTTIFYFNLRTCDQGRGQFSNLVKTWVEGVQLEPSSRPVSW